MSTIHARRTVPEQTGVGTTQVTYAACLRAVGPPQAAAAVATETGRAGVRTHPASTHPDSTHTSTHSTRLALLSTCSFREVKGTPSRSSWPRPRHWTSGRGFWARQICQLCKPPHPQVMGAPTMPFPKKVDREKETKPCLIREAMPHSEGPGPREVSCGVGEEEEQKANSWGAGWHSKATYPQSNTAVPNTGLHGCAYF